MKTNLLATMLAGVLTLTACSSTAMNAESEMNKSNKDKAVALLNSIETGDQTAISYVNPAHYTQHNLAVEDGLAGFGALLQALPKNLSLIHI